MERQENGAIANGVDAARSQCRQGEGSIREWRIQKDSQTRGCESLAVVKRAWGEHSSNADRMSWTSFPFQPGKDKDHLRKLGQPGGKFPGVSKDQWGRGQGKNEYERHRTKRQTNQNRTVWGKPTGAKKMNEKCDLRECGGQGHQHKKRRTPEGKDKKTKKKKM